MSNRKLLYIFCLLFIVSASFQMMGIAQDKSNPPVQLTENGTDDIDGAWSPDGTQILFSSNRDGDYELFVMDIDGTNVVQLTENGTDDIDGAWSPDGTQILFSSNRDGDFELFVMDADGSNLVQLTENGTDDIRGAWSLDGTQILFSSNRDGDYELFVMDMMDMTTSTPTKARG